MIRPSAASTDEAATDGSMRLIEYALAVIAIVAAGILAFVR
jgi:hypothetical protein